MTGRTIIVDRGWQNIKTVCRELQGEGVKVGIRAAGAGARDVDDVRIIDYAVWNEFGTEDGHVPARPFMRRSADTSKTILPQFLRRLADNVISARGGISARQAMTQLGLFYQAHIRKTILDSPNWAKPNSPKTIAAKGSSVPLVDTGAMTGAVDFERVRR